MNDYGYDDNCCETCRQARIEERVANRARLISRVIAMTMIGVYFGLLAVFYTF